MSNAPICHIPPNVATNQPPPVPLPSIPPAQPNLASLTATVNAMRQVLLFLVGQLGAQGPQGTPGAAGKPAPAGSWTQQEVVTQVVRIFQDNDPSSPNYVDVERVNKLVMGNNTTKQTWVFNRPPDTGGT